MNTGAMSVIVTALATETIVASGWPIWWRACGMALLMAHRQNSRFMCLKSWKRLSKPLGAARRVRSDPVVSGRGLCIQFRIFPILVREIGRNAERGLRIAE